MILAGAVVLFVVLAILAKLAPDPPPPLPGYVPMHVSSMVTSRPPAEAQAKYLAQRWTLLHEAAGLRAMAIERTPGGATRITIAGNDHRDEVSVYASTEAGAITKMLKALRPRAVIIATKEHDHAGCPSCGRK